MKTLKLFTIELFYALTTALLIFTALELLIPGIITAYLNFTLLLLSWLILGIIIVLTMDTKHVG